jgi:hypothetical protein
MKTFNEWFAETHNPKNSDSILTDNDALLSNQLEQFVDRVHGILYELPDDKRQAFMEKFINDLRNKA